MNRTFRDSLVHFVSSRNLHFTSCLSRFEGRAKLSRESRTTQRRRKPSRPGSHSVTLRYTRTQRTILTEGTQAPIQCDRHSDGPEESAIHNFAFLVPCKTFLPVAKGVTFLFSAKSSPLVLSALFPQQCRC